MEPIIRQCTKDDFSDISRLIQEFHAEALKEYGLECEMNEVCRAIRDSLTETLVLEVSSGIVGVISGKIIDYPLQKAKIYQETIWFVSKDYRAYGRKLLTELERHCKARGIMAIIMVALGNSMTERLDVYYKRCGYKMLETHYIRGLL